MIASLAQETKTAIKATLDSETSLQAVCTTQSAGITAFLNTSVKIPDHLEIEGDWNGVCVCGHPVSENIQDMVFKCVYRNGSYSYVTPTYSPLVWSNDEGTQTVTFSYTENDITVTAELSATVVAILESIAVSGTWENVQYAGRAVDTTGLSVIATFNNGRTEDITSSASVSPSVWSDTIGTQTATFSYTHGGITATATKDAEVQSAWQGLPVGGIVFYIDNTADGTYTFHNANDEEVPAPAVGTDCTGWTYEVTGASKDKYYVVYNELYTSKRWTYYKNGAFVYTNLGTSRIFGTGKTNTATVMSADNGAYITSNSNGYPTVWYQIQQMRTNKVGGCDDWFVGSEYELNALRTSGAGNSATWFSGNYIWASSEDGASGARRWGYPYSNWSYGGKYLSTCVCGFRAF